MLQYKGFLGLHDQDNFSFYKKYSLLLICLGLIFFWLSELHK